MVVALDYNHARNCWDPEPPAAFRAFPESFFAWRNHNGRSNRVGDERVACCPRQA